MDHVYENMVRFSESYPKATPERILWIEANLDISRQRLLDFFGISNKKDLDFESFLRDNDDIAFFVESIFSSFMARFRYDFKQMKTILLPSDGDNSIFDEGITFKKPESQEQIDLTLKVLIEKSDGLATRAMIEFFRARS